MGKLLRRKCFDYEAVSKNWNVKNGQICSCPHSYPQLLLLLKLIDRGLATSNHPMSFINRPRSHSNILWNPAKVQCQSTFFFPISLLHHRPVSNIPETGRNSSSYYPIPLKRPSNPIPGKTGGRTIVPPPTCEKPEPFIHYRPWILEKPRPVDWRPDSVPKKNFWPAFLPS